ncbi:unnamed protein product [Closterium sp. NIES-53]
MTPLTDPCQPLPASRGLGPASAGTRHQGHPWLAPATSLSPPILTASALRLRRLDIMAIVTHANPALSPHPHIPPSHPTTASRTWTSPCECWDSISWPSQASATSPRAMRMPIPSLSPTRRRAHQNLISDAIADLYLWPKTIELYHEEPKLAVGWLTISAMRASNLRNQGLVGTSDPYLQHCCLSTTRLLHMLFPPPCPPAPCSTSRLAVGWLTISAMRASNLRNLGLVGTSDPYLHFYLTSSLGSRESSVRDNDLNPDWGDEELRLKVLDPATQKLHVEVFDKNTVRGTPWVAVHIGGKSGCTAHSLLNPATQKLHVEVFDKNTVVALMPSPFPISPFPIPGEGGKADGGAGGGAERASIGEIQQSYPLSHPSPTSLSLASPHPTLVLPRFPPQGKADRLMGVQLVALSELAVGEAKDFELRLAPRFSDLGGAQSGGRSRRDIGSVCFRLLYNELAVGEPKGFELRLAPRFSDLGGARADDTYHAMARGGWHVVDGTWWMARGGWHELDGTCWMACAGWHVVDGTCWMARAGWHVLDGTWWMARAGWHVVDGTWWME